MPIVTMPEVAFLSMEFVGTRALHEIAFLSMEFVGARAILASSVTFALISGPSQKELGYDILALVCLQISGDLAMGISSIDENEPRL